MAERVRAKQRFLSVGDTAGRGFGSPGTEELGGHTPARRTRWPLRSRPGSIRRGDKTADQDHLGQRHCGDPADFPKPIDCKMTTIPITADVFTKFVESAFKAREDETTLLSEANTAYGPSVPDQQLSVHSWSAGAAAWFAKDRPSYSVSALLFHITGLRSALGERPAIGRFFLPIKASNLPLSP